MKRKDEKRKGRRMQMVRTRIGACKSWGVDRTGDVLPIVMLGSPFQSTQPSFKSMNQRTLIVSARF